MDTTTAYEGLPGATALPPGHRTRLTAEVRAALAVLAGLALLGVAQGMLWSAVSPRVHVVITAAGPDLAHYGSDELFAVDGTFALLGAAAGVLTGIAVWFAVRRWRGPLLMGGLVLGSLLCGLVTWQVGRRIGLGHYHSLLHSTDAGRQFSQPVDLRSWAALVPQPFLALAGYLVLAAWVARPDLGRRVDRVDRPDGADLATRAAEADRVS